MVKITGKACHDFRKQRGINQKSFWELVGLTQSGGSRYENGREIPENTQMVISYVYGLGSGKKALLDAREKAEKLLTKARMRSGRS